MVHTLPPWVQEFRDHADCIARAAADVQVLIARRFSIEEKAKAFDTPHSWVVEMLRGALENSHGRIPYMLHDDRIKPRAHERVLEAVFGKEVSDVLHRLSNGNEGGWSGRERKEETS